VAASDDGFQSVRLPLTAADVRAGVQALAAALSPGERRVGPAQDAWRAALERCGCGAIFRSSPALAALARHYRQPLDAHEPTTLLLAAQSYYAIVVQTATAAALRPWVNFAGWDALLAATNDSQRAAALAEFDQAHPLHRHDDAPATRVWHWYVDAPTPNVGRMIQDLAQRLAAAGLSASLQPCCPPGDLFNPLYQRVLPRPVRHALGEYYTPPWLAAFVLDQAGYHGQAGGRLLDPTCGSGTFLTLAIARRRRAAAGQGRTAGGDSAALCRDLVDNVAGIDLNPLAALAARANYLLALGELAPHVAPTRVPIFCRDALLDSPPDTHAAAFDVVVGNPPWIAWDTLPDDYRRATRDLWQAYGLFSLDASAARHGGAKKDLAMLVTYVAADRYLRPGGRMAFVVPQTMFQTSGAGDGFRRFRLGPGGDGLRVLEVNDLVTVRPFGDAANWTATLLLEKGPATRYPVAYWRWSADTTGDGEPAAGGFRRRPYEAAPLSPASDTSPWFVMPAGCRTDLRALLQPADYRAYLGANSGGANGVYWLEILEVRSPFARVRNVPQRGKSAVAGGTHWIEAELLFPLLRWGDVRRGAARPELFLLLAQDPATRRGIALERMQRDFPLALAYLEQHRALLERRAAYRRYQGDQPFYSMYNVGTYTLAPLKVVWRRMDRQINAAVVATQDDALLGRRVVVPQETCSFIPAASEAEAHYLAGLLNSRIFEFLIRQSSVDGGKGFGSPGILNYIHLPRFDAQRADHQALANASRGLHAGDTAGQSAVDCGAASVWGLSLAELAALVNR